MTEQSTLPKPKPGILDISPYVAGKSKAAAEAEAVIKLSSNESTLGPSPAAIKAFNEHASKLYRYPDSASLELRKAIAHVHKIDADRIVCGAGSDELIGLLVHAYAGAGDEVLYSQYGFLMYKIYAQGAGATPVIAPEEELTANVNALLAKVTPRTKIVFIANPNNPTGSYLPASELRRLRSELRKDVLLVVDAAYAEYVEPLEYPDYSAGKELVDATENTVMLRTFSKIYGLSSLRLGWGYFPAAIADVINRVRGPFNVSAVAQAVGMAAVEDAAYVQRVREHNTVWLSWMSDELLHLGLTVYPSIANFILVEFAKEGKTSSAAAEFLMKKGIIPREVGGYGLHNHLRITIGTEKENRALVEAIRVFMS